MSVVDERVRDLDDAVALGRALVHNLEQVVLGSEGALVAAVVAALSGGHLLIEDVPGVGKTVLARALAVSLGAELSRVQGHPDLLPSDITGVSVFMPDTGSWDFRPGPVFAHVVLVDELNRTPPRTQSALLETMEERQVSVDGQSWPLPQPHLVIATQNPQSQRGTFPLVESQLDRFAMATSIGYPDAAQEVRLALHGGGTYALAELRPVCTTAEWRRAQDATEAVSVHEAVAAYAVELCRASRTAPGVHLGASPRAAIWLIRAAQAHAVLDARPYVVPNDVKAVAPACLSHRILTLDPDGGADRVGRGRGGPPRSDPHAQAVSRWARPARPRAPMVAGVFVIGLWWLVAHNAGSGWMQVMGDLVFGVLLIGILGPFVVVTRARVRVRSAPGDGSAGLPVLLSVDSSSRVRVRPVVPPGPEVFVGPRRRHGAADEVVTVLPVRRGVHDTVEVDIASAAPFALQWWSRRVRLPLPSALHVSPRCGRGAALSAATGRRHR